MVDAKGLILGGGFGGLTVASEIRNSRKAGVEITVVDRRGEFSMGLSKLWVLAGYRGDDNVGDRALLRRKGIHFVKDEIAQIDADRRIVKTSSPVLAYDYLVVALGAEPMPTLIPGFSEVGFNRYAREEIGRLRDSVARLEEGRIVIFIGLPYKCPPAPYEGAIIIDELLRQKGVRSSASMEVHTPTLIRFALSTITKEGFGRSSSSSNKA